MKHDGNINSKYSEDWKAIHVSKHTQNTMKLLRLGKAANEKTEEGSAVNKKKTINHLMEAEIYTAF